MVLKNISPSRKELYVSNFTGLSKCAIKIGIENIRKLKLPCPEVCLFFFLPK